ncbi:hypothetical protein [Streptomyces sp. SPB074]|uniref:hypothetical protein n=1 Tax=Streptomyces sp. (strain SPB074) TaxID=465543 RepID=UPI00017F0E6F|nr:hypothetical protein [Streptomyces sp. SPB074]EDY43937.1 hypothetical protein SSBG_02127 [Streptomyces sp. SPB074]
MHFCHWWEDDHGGRYLIPGCNSRAIDPDSTDCTCPSLARQLDAARRSIERLQRAAQSRTAWHDAVVRAVHEHPDGIQIMKAAADAAA